MLGLNIKVDFIAMVNGSDDNVGGAYVTGTVSYAGIPARISLRRPSQMSLEAGLEVDRIADMIIGVQGLVVNERDEVRVSAPADHPMFGDRFRILGVQRDSRRHTIGHTEFTMSRIERSRRQQ